MKITQNRKLSGVSDHKVSLPFKNAKLPSKLSLSSFSFFRHAKSSRPRNSCKQHDYRQSPVEDLHVILDISSANSLLQNSESPIPKESLILILLGCGCRCSCLFPEIEHLYGQRITAYVFVFCVFEIFIGQCSCICERKYVSSSDYHEIALYSLQDIKERTLKKSAFFANLQPC